MTSQARPASAVPSLRNKAMTFTRSLKGGRAPANSGVTTAWAPCPGLMASFMRQRISPASDDSKARAAKRPARRVKRTKTALKMPTTTNNRRAYIRRSLIIPWSSQRRSYEVSTAPLRVDGQGWGGLQGGRRRTRKTNKIQISNDGWTFRAVGGSVRQEKLTKAKE